MHYEITDIAHRDYPDSYQIRATQDLGFWVKKGELGGYLMTHDNLTDSAWLGADSVIIDRGVRVSGNAYVLGRSLLSGNAVVKDRARVSGDVCVSNGAVVSGTSTVRGNVTLSYSTVSDAHVDGGGGVLDLYNCTVKNAEVLGHGYMTSSNVHGGSFRGNMSMSWAELLETGHVFRVGPVGSENHEAVLYRKRKEDSDGHALKIGCWTGTVDGLAEKVQIRAAWNWNGTPEVKQFWRDQYELLEKQCRLVLKSWDQGKTD